MLAKHVQPRPTSYLDHPPQEQHKSSIENIDEASSVNLGSRVNADHSLVTQVAVHRPRSWYVVRDVNISEQRKRSTSRDGTSFTQSEGPEASSRRLASKMQKLHGNYLTEIELPNV